MSHDGHWARRLRLLRVLLQRGEISTVQAARLLGVDRRRARSDLKAFEMNGVPVTPIGENRERRWVVAEGWRHLGFHIGQSERLAMLFGRELVDTFLTNTAFGDAFANLEHHIQALDPAGLCGDELRRRFCSVCEAEATDRYGEHRTTIDILIAAILGSYRVSFDYSLGEDETVQSYTGIAPLTLAVYKGALYMLFERRGEGQALAVERVARIESHPRLLFDYPTPGEYDPRALVERLEQSVEQPAVHSPLFTRSAE